MEGVLDTIDEQGNVSWTCMGLGATCRTINTYHISHKEMYWNGEQHIWLPPCTACHARTSIYVHQDEELVEPLITRDEITGKILQAADNPDPHYRDNIWIKYSDIVHTPLPHPTMQHMSVEEIKALQAHTRTLAPNAPVEWMLTEMIHEDIHSVTCRPFVAHHRALAEQLKAIGKMYVPRPEMEESDVSAG